MIVQTSDFKFEITKDELENHLRARIEHHKGKAAKFKAKAEKLRATDGNMAIPEELLSLFEEVDEWGSRGQRGLRDVKGALRENVARLTASLEGQADVHAHRATVLTFFVDHLPLPLSRAIVPGRGYYEINSVDVERFELLPEAHGGLAGLGLANYAPAVGHALTSSPKSLEDWVELG